MKPEVSGALAVACSPAPAMGAGWLREAALCWAPTRHRCGWSDELLGQFPARTTLRLGAELPY